MPDVAAWSNVNGELRVIYLEQGQSLADAIKEHATKWNVDQASITPGKPPKEGKMADEPVKPIEAEKPAPKPEPKAEPAPVAPVLSNPVKGMTWADHASKFRKAVRPGE